MDELKRIEINLTNGVRVIITDKRYDISRKGGKVIANRKKGTTERITEPMYK